MVRGLVSVFFVHTLAEDGSLMQAADLDVMHSQGNSMTIRMQQSTRQMEDQYKAILNNVVTSGSWDDPKTGNPWVPNKGLVLDPVNRIIEDMEGELGEQKDLNTNIMGSHTLAVEACNAARDAALTGQVNSLKGSMQGARTAHKTCRGAEDTAIQGMETECKSFDDLSKCDHEQNWFAGWAEGSTGPGTLDAVVKQAQSCKSGIAATSAKAVDCDGKQDAFKGSFCDYASELQETCDTHNDCYNAHTGNWDAASTSILVLEKEQKVIYRVMQRIRCYLNLLFGAENGSTPPSQADIDTCSATSHEEKADADLTIDYGQKAPVGTCYGADAVKDESVDNRPGSPEWSKAELDAYKAHDKLQSNSAC